MVAMHEPTDSQLLRDYALAGHEGAFRELVVRHANFVYSAALRQMDSPDLAGDIAQSVFTDLARKARPLAEKNSGSLAGWLHRSTRYAALNQLRATRRRRANERQAMEQLLINSESAPDWERIRPVLDEALDSLADEDREALLLRYFKNQDFRTVGLALGVSDDTAQKRVSRAVERLREFFLKRNVTIGAGGLAVVISANAVQAAPAGLALTISNASLAAAGTTLTFMKIATVTKLKLAFGAIVVAGAVTAFVVLQQNQIKLRGENESLRHQIAQLQADHASLSNRIATTGEASKLPAEQFNELLKLRGEVGVFRRQLNEVTEKNFASQNAVKASNTNSLAPQIHLKARFLTMPKDVLAGMGSPASLNGILTSENFSNILQKMEAQNDIETLAEPEVTTTSGRQTQMRVTQVVSVVTNFCLQETNGSSSIVAQVGPVETGPIFDATPRVLSDGYTIELPVIASLTDFLGYAPSTKTTPAYTAGGQEVDVPTVSPQFRVQQSTNLVNLLDNQTLVFALNDDHVPAAAALGELDGSKSKLLDRQTLVFITATLVDAAGNRIHGDDGNSSNASSPSAAQ